MALERHDKGKNTGTQTAGSSEGAIADGQMAIDVHILMSGTPATILADYATLVTAVGAVGSAKRIDWNKR